MDDEDDMEMLTFVAQLDKLQHLLSWEIFQKKKIYI